MNEHTQGQGLRVHHLANLGGLLAIAELDREPPDFLLGALLGVAQERDELTADQRSNIAAAGRQKLNERASANRAWKSWQRSRDLHTVTLTTAQVDRLIETLGGSLATDCENRLEKLIALLNGKCRA